MVYFFSETFVLKRGIEYMQKNNWTEHIISPEENITSVDVPIGSKECNFKEEFMIVTAYTDKCIVV